MPPNVHHSAEADTSSFVQQPSTQQRQQQQKQQQQRLAKVLPLEKPPFTVGDLKRAIPARCFEPTFGESFLHLGKDLAEVAFYAVAMWYLDQPLYNLSPALWAATWVGYMWMQGVVMTGVWVLAHECGHGAFTTSSTVNDLVGFVLHTMLSVPFFSWQHTHANHHHFTNNLQKDEVFVPRKRSEVELTSAYKKVTNPAFVFAQLVFMLLFGWPLYLLINTSGHVTDGFASHFLPTSPIFTRKERVKVVISNLGLLGWWYCLYLLGNAIGSGLVLRLYLLPLIVTNGFLVAITYMQHTHADVPHYDSDEWNWLRGALCTVDRTMGPYLDRKLHLIHVTHVLHHIFPRIPYYRSKEASDALVKVIGKYYHKDDSNYLVSMWKNARDQVFLEEGSGILFWLTETH